MSVNGNSRFRTRSCEPRGTVSATSSVMVFDDGYEDNLGPGAARADGRLEIVDEGSLWSSVGLVDKVAELVAVVGNAAVNGIVHPVTVENLAGVELVAVERKLLEALGARPSWDLLAGVELAACDGLKVREILQKVGEHGTVLARDDEVAVGNYVLSVEGVDFVHDLSVFAGECKVAPDL